MFENAADGSQKVAVELRGVTKYFGSTLAVNDISLQVMEGEFVSLLGPSGCGKTTALRMIAGSEHVSSGEIWMGNENVAKKRPYERNIGMVFQNYALFPHMTVYENVKFGLQMKKFPKGEIDRRIRNALSMVKLDHMENRLPKQMSGGQQQRLALARAIVYEPKVLLLDEPLSNLDAKLRQEMRVELIQIQKQLGITTIFVTHDQSEALALSDKIVVMRAGEIEQIGTAFEIYENPKSHFIADFIGSSNFLKGTILGKNDRNELEIDTEKGLRLVSDMAGDFKRGDPVWVAVRKEKVEVQIFVPPERGPINAFPGKIKFLTYLGSCIEYLCEINQSQDKMVVGCDTNRGEIPFKEEQEVILSWSPQDSIVIHASK